MMLPTRLLAIMRKELLHLRRDRISVGLIAGIPVMQLLLFGYAINMDVRNLKAGIVDQAQTHLSRQFIADLNQTQVLDIRYVKQSPGELEELIRGGKISVGVYIPGDFDRRAMDNTRPAANLMVDGADPTILGVANKLVNIPIRLDTGMPPNIPTPAFEVRPYYNPERRTVVNIVPGLIGVILTLTMMMFTAVAIVREREHGNLELLINTPVSNGQLMMGKVLPYIFIGLIQLALVVTVGKYLFKVPVRGSMLDLYLGASVFIAANLSLGLMLSTIARTQFQAMQMTFFILMPSILLSGFIFPFDGMPVLAQYLGEVLPITHFIRITRGIMLREASLIELRGEVYMLLAFTLVAMTAAVLRFSRRLD
jgi:ABC-2 type transport system permease protein